MTFEQFSTGGSLLHQADPRGKLVSAGLLSLVVALCQQPRTALTGLLLSLLLTAAAQLPWTRVLRRLLIVNGFNAFLLLILPLTYGGAEIVRFAGFDLSLSGLQLAVLIHRPHRPDRRRPGAVLAQALGLLLHHHSNRRQPHRR